MNWRDPIESLTQSEVSQLAARAQTCRDQLDGVNQLALQNELAPLHYRHKRAIFTEFDASLPPIVSSFMPKSGGTFLHNRMLEVGYMEFWWAINHPQSASTVYAVPNALKLYRGGGCACHTHALPDPHTLAVFDDVELDRIWVHLRHPAEATISSFYHYQGEGQGEGAVAAERRSQAQAQAQALGLPTERDAFVRTGIHFMVTWLRHWATFAQRHPDRVYLTYYHQLEDPAALLATVVSDFGGGERAIALSAERPDDRRRLAARSDWRDGLSSETIAHVQRTVHEELSGFEILEPLWR